jgi:hypothetical protein
VALDHGVEVSELLFDGLQTAEFRTARSRVTPAARRSTAIRLQQ